VVAALHNAHVIMGPCGIRYAHWCGKIYYRVQALNVGVCSETPACSPPSYLLVLCQLQRSLNQAGSCAQLDAVLLVFHFRPLHTRHAGQCQGQPNLGPTTSGKSMPLRVIGECLGNRTDERLTCASFWAFSCTCCTLICCEHTTMTVKQGSVFKITGQYVHL